uniref:MFS domain-containing protein n=1 Tax=Macrostomum lignano TaxID=282301 RepID=A0A1I8FIW6_9PLAT
MRRSRHRQRKPDRGLRRPRLSSDFDGIGDGEETYTVEHAVEKLGILVRFQLRILFICGIMTAADAMEMLLLSVLGPALRCDWQLSSAQVAIITTVVFAGISCLNLPDTCWLPGRPKKAAAVIDQIARDNRKPPMTGRPVAASVT